MLEYILFKYRDRNSIDSKNYKYLSVLKEEGICVYHYYVINNYIHFKKRITKNTIEYLTEKSLISSRVYFSSDVDFLNFNLGLVNDVGVVYRYNIM